MFLKDWSYSFWRASTHSSRHSSSVSYPSRPSSAASTGTARSYSIAFSRASSRPSSHSISARTAPSPARSASPTTRVPSTSSFSRPTTATRWSAKSTAASRAWCSERSRAPPITSGSIDRRRAIAVSSRDVCASTSRRRTICPFWFFPRARASTTRVWWCSRRAASRSTPQFVPLPSNTIRGKSFLLRLV